MTRRLHMLALASLGALPVLPGLGSGCIGANRPQYRPAFIRDVDTSSDKAVQVVSNARMEDHEARPISAAAVGAALLSSGLFNDDDARELGAPLADELSAMDQREHIRIVAWADDAPRIYYLRIHDGKLRISYYKRGEELERFEAVVASEAVALGPTASASPAPSPTAAPGPEATPAPDAGSAVVSAPAPDAAVTVAALTPAPTPAPKQKRPRKPRPALPAITEAEARRKLHELDAALQAGLLVKVEYKARRRAILARL